MAVNITHITTLQPIATNVIHIMILQQTAENNNCISLQPMEQNNFQSMATIIKIMLKTPAKGCKYWLHFKPMTKKLIVLIVLLRLLIAITKFSQQL